MRIVDANVLLYALNPAGDHHVRSKAWLDGALGGNGTVGMPWVVLLAFLRLSTRGSIFPRPLAVPVALDVVSDWLAQPRCVVPRPTSRHLGVLSGLLREVGTGGNLVTDAHVAALAVEHDASIVSWDGDFSRFRGVRVEQP